MKKLIFSAALVLSLGLAGCGDSSINDKPKESNTNAEAEQKVLAKTTEDVIQHFKDDNLEIGEVSDITK
ncbi:hypothetical protein FH508_0012250 [Lysinibacillus sp. CD3-6]|uniref:hypothetical protein n=1 Tax=Lysinibacillus sp. CD3-6 TaxID=2892541 RepID=UPI001D175FFE|nr:hypothetical protein [Lysinibacillus sp. CD3-6]UED78241.1 hypothetical protein FH508_0012250 [Lysinibacillus sp. CD3-6]